LVLAQPLRIEGDGFLHVLIPDFPLVYGVKKAYYSAMNYEAYNAGRGLALSKFASRWREAIRAGELGTQAAEGLLKRMGYTAERELAGMERGARAVLGRRGIPIEMIDAPTVKELADLKAEGGLGGFFKMLLDPKLNAHFFGASFNPELGRVTVPKNIMKEFGITPAEAIAHEADEAAAYWRGGWRPGVKPTESMAADSLFAHADPEVLLREIRRSRMMPDASAGMRAMRGPEYAEMSKALGQDIQTARIPARRHAQMPMAKKLRGLSLPDSAVKPG